jgi:hypothetical protein
MNDSIDIELSICIPTYNRATLLAESLEVLLPQCIDRPVEICISNNASTDETAKMLATYLLAGNSRIRHQTRGWNIGIDRNILAALRMARGRYVLPIGDDEMIGAHGVDSILAALQNKPDMLMLNGWHRARPHLPASLQGRTITDLREAFQLLWDKMPLGGFVIGREYAEPEYSDRYLGTHHAYSGAVWDYLLDQPRARVDCMSHPVIEFRKVAKAWAAQADTIRSKEIPLWFGLIPAFYAGAVEPSFQEYKQTWGRTRSIPNWFAGLFRSHA